MGLVNEDDYIYKTKNIRNKPDVQGLENISWNVFTFYYDL